MVGFLHNLGQTSSLLLALDNPTVDFLSLDIEGGELEVLRTVPWDQVCQF